MRETRSRKPVPNTIVKDRKRSRIMPRIPRPGLGATFQTVFKASCNCPNTPEAPKSSVAIPRMVAVMPPPTMVPVGKHLLQGASYRFAHDALDLVGDPPLGRLGAKHETGGPDSQ